jgi:hypothetical protein
MAPWRVGRHYNIHVYEGERPVATFFSPEDAALAVKMVNKSKEALMAKYEYTSQFYGFKIWGTHSTYLMNEAGKSGWHIFHLHEMIRDSEPGLMVYMARKLEDEGDKAVKDIVADCIKDYERIIDNLKSDLATTDKALKDCENARAQDQQRLFHLEGGLEQANKNHAAVQLIAQIREKWPGNRWSTVEPEKLRKFHEWLYVMVIQPGDEAAPTAYEQQLGKPLPKRDYRPTQCRNRLRDEGKPHPKSGCEVCRDGGIRGCPYEKAMQKSEEISGEEATRRYGKAYACVEAPGHTDLMVSPEAIDEALADEEQIDTSDIPEVPPDWFKRAKLKIPPHNRAQAIQRLIQEWNIELKLYVHDGAQQDLFDRLKNLWVGQGIETHADPGFPEDMKR